MSGLSELKEACRARAVAIESQLIRAGASVWLAGHPAPASEGTIALANGLGTRIIIIETADVQDVERKGAAYRVKVAADTKVLVRADTGTDATTASLGCSQGMGVIAQNNDRPRDDAYTGDTFVIEEDVGCSIVYMPVSFPTAGGARIEFWPVGISCNVS